jgi:anti-anti-sigma factor
MSNALKVHTRTTEKAAIIELHGDVSSDGDAAIKEAYRNAVADGAATILFNLSQTQYINTSGISVLISVVMEAKKAGHKILVCGVSPHYKKVFDLVRFSVYVTMFDTEEQALGSLEGAGSTQPTQPSQPSQPHP